MGLAVVQGARLSCTMGASVSVLTVLPRHRSLSSTMPVATIMDHVSLVNIGSFGMCSSPTNPVVAAATAAKMGVFTPMPCIPATAAPWMPGATTVLHGTEPTLEQTSTCLCAWNGIVSIVDAGQQKELLPP